MLDQTGIPIIVVVILSLLSCLQGLVCYWMGYDRGSENAREKNKSSREKQLTVHPAPEQMELTQEPNNTDEYIIPIEEPVPASYDSSIMSHDPGHSI